MARKDVLFGEALDLNTLCRDCSNHTTLVGGLWYPGGDKSEKVLARKGVLSGGALDLNTLCRDCSNHTTLVGGLLYPGRDKSEKVYTSYKV